MPRQTKLAEYLGLQKSDQIRPGCMRVFCIIPINSIFLDFFVSIVPNFDKMISMRINTNLIFIENVHLYPSLFKHTYGGSINKRFNEQPFQYTNEVGLFYPHEMIECVSKLSITTSKEHLLEKLTFTNIIF